MIITKADIGREVLDGDGRMEIIESVKDGVVTTDYGFKYKMNGRYFDDDNILTDHLVSFVDDYKPEPTPILPTSVSLLEALERGEELEDDFGNSFDINSVSTNQSYELIKTPHLFKVKEKESHYSRMVIIPQSSESSKIKISLTSEDGFSSYINVNAGSKYEITIKEVVCEDCNESSGTVMERNCPVQEHFNDLKVPIKMCSRCYYRQEQEIIDND